MSFVLSTKKHLQKGLSLIEASMVLALSAVVIASVMAYYQYASDNEKLDKLSVVLNQIVASVSVLYANSNDGYKGLNATLVKKLNPGIGKIDADGRLILPTGNELRIVGNYDYNGNKIWYFTVNNIDPGMCSSILFTMLNMKKAAHSPVLWYTYNEAWNNWITVNPADARVDSICNKKFNTIDIAMGFN